MTLAPRTLFAKIFAWFCFTIVASTLLVVVIAVLTGKQPFGRRWMAMTQDLYAQSAVDFYTHGGDGVLKSYAEALSQKSGIEGHLFLNPKDASSLDVFHQPLPEADTGTFLRTLHTGTPSAHLGRKWTAASVVTRDGSTYIFVMQAHPARGFLDGTFFLSMAPRLLLGLVIVGFCCFLLARHITRPVRTLQSAASQMAAGNLKVRTLPALRGRDDELASMAGAFDSMAERIEGLLETERQMLADISHELRSPLTRIGVSLELLRRGETDVLDAMQDDLDRVNAMIGQVLELSRFELLQTPMHLENVDLCQMLREIVDHANLEGRATEKVVLLEAPESCMLQVDRGLMASALENMIRNALQYSPSRSTIRVGLSTTKHGTDVRIEDEGPGVPAASLEAIFQPFHRVPSIAEHLGYGLGLSIAARIIKRHHGSIAATNRDPQGLIVAIHLPHEL